MISGAVGPGDHEQGSSSIWLVSILGGKPRQLRGGAYRGEVSPDGSLVAYMKLNNEIWLADADGENPRPFVVEEHDPGGVGSPKWSPDGRRLVYRRTIWEQGRVVGTIESRGLDEQSPTVLVREELDIPSWGPPAYKTWASDFLAMENRLVYARDEPPPRRNDVNLWEIAIDPRSGKPRGEPRRLTDWAGFGVAVLSATADGSQFAFINFHNQADVFVSELVEGGRRLRSPRRLTLDDRHDAPEGWAPDSRVVFRSDRYGSDDLFVQGLDDRNARELAVGAGDQGFAQLTPDGKSFLYWEVEEGLRDKQRLLRIPVGGGPAELVLEVPRPAFFACATTPGGPCRLAEVLRDEGAVKISEIDPVEGRGKELSRIPHAGMNLRSGALSPDGYTWALVGGVEPSIHLAGKVEREIGIHGLPFRGPTDVAWSPDGNGFYVTGESERGILLLYVDMQGEAEVLYEIGNGNLFAPRPSPDGRYLAFGQETADSNAWLIEKF